MIFHVGVVEKTESATLQIQLEWNVLAQRFRAEKMRTNKCANLINLKTLLKTWRVALPQLFNAVERVFRAMDYELGRYEGSMLEIGNEKLKWAKEFKELFDCMIEWAQDDDETTFS